MGRLRLALVNTAFAAAETRRNFCRELDAEIVSFHAPSGELPAHGRFDGFVVTGSRASVYWDREWIDELKAWTKTAISAGLPALGVCYGHQLLAAVQGGRVEAMSEYELGYRTVAHDSSNQLMKGIPETFTVFTSHSDRVAEVPPDATVFAENGYGVQGFQRNHTFGVQFHSEYDMEMATTITAGKDDQLPAERIQRVLDDITEATYKEACEAKRLFDNFVNYVRTVQANKH